MPGDSLVAEAEGAVGVVAEDGERRGEREGALRRSAATRVGRRDKKPRRAREALLRPGQVADGPADLAVLNRRSPDHARADAEGPDGEVGYAHEADPDRADEGIALLPRGIPGQGGELQAEVVGGDLDPVVVSLSDLGHERIP